MSEDITVRIHVLLLACLKVNSQGKHHVFFDFAGHVNSVSVYAVEARRRQFGKPDRHTLPEQYVYVTPRHYDLPGQAEKRICRQLDEAIKAVNDLLKVEVVRVA